METTRIADEIETLLRGIAAREDCGEGDPCPGMTYYQESRLRLSGRSARLKALKYYD